MAYRYVNGTKKAADSVGSWIRDDDPDVCLEGPPRASASWGGLLVLGDEGGESGVRVVNSRDSDLLTLAEAAAYLRVHRRTMSRLLRQRVVPGTKIGRQWRVRRADLDAVLSPGMPQARDTDGSAGVAAKPERSSRHD
jgi:excisionase family DNA binding protein